MSDIQRAAADDPFWPQPDYDRLNDLNREPKPPTTGNLRPFDDGDRVRLRKGDPGIWSTAMGEVYQEAYNGHVLLDEVGVPGGDLDARVSVLARALDAKRHHERLGAASDWVGLWAELSGYVGGAQEDGDSLDPAELLAYMRESKKALVVDPFIKAFTSGASS